MLLCDSVSSDGECNHVFCRQCVRKGVGNTQFEKLVSTDTEFICFVCDDTPLHGLQELLESYLEKHSDSDSEQDEHQKGSEDYRAQKLLDKLGQVEVMLDEANQHLEPDHLETIRSEIVLELENPGADQVDEEIEAYKASWQFKADILQEKSSQLQDELSQLGIKPMDFMRELDKTGAREEQKISAAWEDIEYTKIGAEDGPNQQQQDAGRHADEKDGLARRNRILAARKSAELELDQKHPPSK
jgi:hypothetical protein